MKDKIIKFLLGYDNPINLYKQSPFLSILLLAIVIAYAIIGCIIIFNL